MKENNRKRFTHIIPMDFPPDPDIQEWKYVTKDIVPGVHEYYMISNKGNVYNRRSEKLMTPSPVSSGYPAIRLSGEFGAKTINIHSLVGKAFVENPDPEHFTCINHIDGDKTNPDYTNLEWTTPKMNTRHAILNGLMDPTRCAKTTQDQRQEVVNLLNLGIYSCREISDMTGVSKSIVSHIRYGESWSKDHKVNQYNIRKDPISKKVQRLSNGKSKLEA